jgi:hypothetical protein
MAGGVLVLSIDLELEIDKSDAASEQQLAAAGSQLIALTREHSIPAVWAVADPLLSAATDEVLREGARHEIAVLGDRTWIGPGCGRTRLARELERRVGRARKAGLTVSTLALRNVEPTEILELLHEHRVLAVRGPASGAVSLTRKLAAPPVRFGVWQAPPAWRVPLRPRWWLAESWSIRRTIRQAIARQSILHLAIEAPRLIEAGPEALITLAAALSFAAACRAAGQLEIATLGQLAQAALRERASAPARSILRPAA